MSKITKAAENRPCTIRLPGCNGDPASSVWAHINSIRWGAGRGHKAPDICGAIACHHCHGLLDGRIKSDLDRDFIMLAALQGHMESLMILWEEGII